MKKLAIFIFLFSVNCQYVNCQQQNDFSDAAIDEFLMFDKNIEKNSRIIQHHTEFTIEHMTVAAKTNIHHEPLVAKAKEVLEIAESFHAYIDKIRKRMVAESGGSYSQNDAYAENHPEWTGKPRGKKDKDTPQRIFLTGDYGSQGKEEPQGPIIDKRIQALKAAYMEFISTLWDNGGVKGTIFADPTKKQAVLYELAEKLTLTSSENYDPKVSKDKSWAEFTFGNMPVAAICPMLRKFQNDVIISEAAIVNFLSDQMGKLEIEHDKFEVLAQSSKPHILLGETYEADIYLGEYSTNTKFSVSVNGSSLKIIDGKAKYAIPSSSIGQKTYSAKISVQNLLTGEVESFTKDFHYEVIVPALLATPDKMNILYVGVDNPITIAIAGGSSKMVISMTGGTLTKKTSVGYIATADKSGDAVITVKDTISGRSFPFQFRVKRIPDPFVRLGKETDGLIDVATFKSQQGLLAWLDNFDFDAKCMVQSYTLYYTPKGKETIEIVGEGGRWTSAIAAIIGEAKPGDQYVFANVKTKCPGDTVDRRVNSLAFIIK